MSGLTPPLQVLGSALVCFKMSGSRVSLGSFKMLALPLQKIFPALGGGQRARRQGPELRADNILRRYKNKWSNMGWQFCPQQQCVNGHKLGQLINQMLYPWVWNKLNWKHFVTSWHAYNLWVNISWSPRPNGIDPAHHPDVLGWAALVLAAVVVVVVVVVVGGGGGGGGGGGVVYASTRTIQRTANMQRALIWYRMDNR